MSFARSAVCLSVSSAQAVRGRAVLYWLIKAILTPILRGFYRVRIDGREHVPAQGPVILAANHRSFMDSLFLPLVIRRRVTFVAKEIGRAHV